MTETAPSEKAAGDNPAPGTPAVDGRLGQLAASVGGLAARGPAPVETWHPAYCGDIDMRIAADGTWFYAGTPITRRPLVELFARILRKDADRFVLVTPAECVGIVVEDAPFVAVAMARDGDHLRFVTNVGDEVDAGADHALHFVTEPAGGIRPYVHVRGGLWARLTRSLAIDLLDELAEDENGTFAIRAGGCVFPLLDAGPA
jgi:uncharacterized protein